MQTKPLSKIVFEKYDTDGSGHVDEHEFRSMVYDLGHFLTQKEVQIAIHLIDKDGTGHVDYDEFKAWWMHDKRFDNLRKSPAEMKWLQDSIKYFRAYDPDSSGTIHSSEFAKLHANLKAYKWTDLDEATCLRELDTDCTGSISFNEFIEWMQRKVPK
eukprot:TRINITY_DN10976_c0_g1_i1.p1 TRINITY_DN10976_c0_g1~~TRINITY_DN10976_c0_g1_i1.p1  ORF type:complete len:157 (-),score=24.87 TRINITY_DN10976_c0_g1_i1:44-514(-)